MLRLLDLFCGRWGWSRAFAARGWECVGVDLVEPPEIPARCEFVQCDILKLTSTFLDGFDFACASSPCEQFSIHRMPHFYKNPPFPEMGLKLFLHTADIFMKSGVPYVMENVRAAEKFVGPAVNHCGPFYLWGDSVPPIMPQGIRKNMRMGNGSIVNKLYRSGDREALSAYRYKSQLILGRGKESTARAATIPIELANCVCDYAERLLEQNKP